MKNQEVDVEVKDTKIVLNDSNGVVFNQGTILLQPPSTHPDTSHTTLLPVPVYYDPKTFKILKESIPADLRESLKEFVF